MTEAPKLLPCPFCGGEARFQAIQGNNPQPFAWDVIHHCIGGFLRFDPRDENLRGSMKMAADTWNTRSDLLSALLAAERRKALEEAAMFCEHHSMDTVTNPEAAEFAGSYVASEALGGGGRHAGMGYAAAIRALMEKEQGE